VKRRNLERLVEDLEHDGFTVKLDTLIAGASGVIHHVDLVAERIEEGRKKIIVGMKAGGKDPAEELKSVFAIAFDVGAEPYYIAAEGFERR
jgi:predicted RNA-binding protein